MMTEYQLQEVRAHTQNREALIEEHLSKIRRWASGAAGRWVDEHDDAYSEALIAFNDAIDAYSPEKGAFLPFAKTAVKNRVTDLRRRELRHSGEFSAEILPETADASSSDAALEIFSLMEELKAFDISFVDLPKASPKAQKTRQACRLVVAHILSNPELLRFVREKQNLPIRCLRDLPQVSEKVLERYRKYIIAGVLIHSGAYSVLQTYFVLERRTR